MGLLLVIISPTGTERRFPLRLGRTVIGRGAGCDLRVSLPTVDVQHCEIVISAASATLTDLGSALGTYHNGQPLESAVLQPGDQITVGSTTMHVRSERPAVSIEIPPSPKPARAAPTSPEAPTSSGV